MAPVKWLIILSISIAIDARHAKSEFDLNSLGKSSELFATSIYKELAQKPGDILISPSSLQTVLALVQMGAKGQTLNEMSRTLALPIDKPSVQRAFKELMPFLRTIKHSTFNSANKIYVQEEFDISLNFSDMAKDSFDAEIESKDFKQAELTANEINEWIESRTNNKIQNLIHKENINALTKMILVNALYFNGEWENTFDPELTRKKNFYVNSTHTELVEMMTTELFCFYNEDNNLDAKFLELPYSGGEFTMTFVLPNQRDGLAALESKLTEVLQPQELERRDVIITIPKFNIAHEVNFKEVLQNLGMVEVFRDDADLSDLTNTGNNLHVSHVVQKSQIELSEKGTEAAAATAAFVIDRIFGGSAFYAGHPFLFVLRESQTKTVEFIGRFTGL